MSNKTTAKSNSRQGISQERSAPLTPQWLVEGNYDSPSWVVRDDNPLSPNLQQIICFDVIIYDPLRPGETCRLTDTEYARLLNTIKRMAYGMRTGKYAFVTTAWYQVGVVRSILNWVSWMLQNNIRRFYDLSREDFDRYANEIVYGPAHLFRYAERIRRHVAALKERNVNIPGRNHPYEERLDVSALLEGTGLDMRRVSVDSAATHELLRIAEAEGYYLTPKRLARLAKQPPEPQMLSAQSISNWLRPWGLQWDLRREIPGDCITFNPFDSVSLIQKAGELGRPSERTKTAPVRQTMELIDACIRWVLTYAPPLLEIRDQYEEAVAKYSTRPARRRHLAALVSSANLPAGPGSPVSIMPSTSGFRDKGIDFGTAVQHFIPLACLVVICAFSGRRHMEALSIRAEGPDNAGCLSRDGQGWWLETYIAKTFQDWDKTPCNELVVAAVEILYRWSAPARALSGGVKLFQYKSFRTQKKVNFAFDSNLKLFVNFLSLTPLPDGSKWDFTPHQFRRFFGIMYFWRYHYGGLDALSYHLRHLNPAMTLRYVTERESGAIFRHVGKDFTTTILTEAALGERNISGTFGERFKATARKLRRRIRRVVKVVSPKHVSKLIERYVENSGRRLKAMPWGYCFSGTAPHQLKSAKCLEHNTARTKTGPDFSQSSPSVCANCPHHLTELIFEPFVRNDLKFHEAAAADPRNGPLLREASRKHARILRRHCERSFEKSQPLEESDV